MECQRRWKCPVKFRVRWLGYGEKDDTWLSASELSCDDLIDEFLEISGRTSEYKVSYFVVFTILALFDILNINMKSYVSYNL